MVQTPTCSFVDCKRPLDSLEELGIGLCHRHYNQLKDESYFTLSCWHCGSLLETIHKHKFVKGVVIKDDYIFAKRCPHCGSIDHRTLDFMTINNKIIPDSLLVNERGELVSSKGDNNSQSKRRQGVRTE